MPPLFSLEPDDFAFAWESDELYPFPSELVNDVDIPEAAKSFLIKAGLPKKVEVAYSTHIVLLPLEPEVPPVQFAAYPLLSLYPDLPIRLLAYLHYDRTVISGLYYGIAEKTGLVQAVSPWNNVGLLVNSSVPQFDESLLAYRDFMRHFRPAGPERSEIEPLITGLEQRWYEIDPKVMASPKDMWPQTIYDMRLNF